METIVTKGLVIRQTNYGEADRVLQIFTEKLGIVSAVAKGARKHKSHQGAAAQLLSYATFTLVVGKGGMYTLRGSNSIESFFALSESLDKLALCTYIFDITRTIVPENMVDNNILSFLLNTLYILKTKNRNTNLIKAVFELKLLALSGFMPDCDGCSVCGKKDTEKIYFSAENGGIVCGGCLVDTKAIPMSASTKKAMEYIINNDVEKIFSFTISDVILSELAKVSENFLLSCAERDFLSLSYYKSVCDI